MEALPVPRISNEAEEAQWWYGQRDRLTEQAEADLVRGDLKLRRLEPLPAQTARNIGGPVD